MKVDSRLITGRPISLHPSFPFPFVFLFFNHYSEELFCNAANIPQRTHASLFVNPLPYGPFPVDEGMNKIDAVLCKGIANGSVTLS